MGTFMFSSKDISYYITYVFFQPKEENKRGFEVGLPKEEEVGTLYLAFISQTERGTMFCP